MSLPKKLSTLLIICALQWAVRVSADEPAAAEGSTTKTNKTAYNASLRSGETVGIHQVQRAFLTVGTNEIAFMIPGEFRMDASNPQKIVLTDNTTGSFITVRISSPPQMEPGTETSFYKGLALNRFPGAKITEESMEFVANHSGPAFNMIWPNSAGEPESVRINFIPSAAGVLEFSVMARTSQFKDALNCFSVLLSSVQNNENGKLVIVPLPDFS